MIKTENEYKECKERLKKEHAHIELQRKKLVESGFSRAQVERAMEPTLSFHEQLKEDVKLYERIKKRNFMPLHSLTEIGQLLIALRIANDISQSELARRLGVDISQVSRDEKNEYHGITIDRAQRILDALNEKLLTQVEARKKAVA